MSKGGVIVLIIAALVFAGLGFVIGQVVQASGNNPGSSDDPVMTQSGVEKMLADRLSTMQSDIEALQALLGESTVETGADNDGEATGNDNDGTQTGDTESKVKVTADSVNVRSSATTSGDNVVATVTANTELTYLGSTNASDGVWYQVRLANGTEGYVASWLCGTPY